MAGSRKIHPLHVEGTDDQHSIIHLLERHGISFEPGVRKVEIEVDGDDLKVLASMAIAARAGGGRAGDNHSVGFVLDVDKPLADRWRQVCDRLGPLGLPLPEMPPTEGYIGFSDEFGVRVEVWLMPDNVTDYGKLEDLLRTLVPSGDKLIQHAQDSTSNAHQLGALFTANNQIKAVLHAWLAWQQEPGLPYGTAVTAKYFAADSPVALRFVDWFKRLYNLS